MKHLGGRADKVSSLSDRFMHFMKRTQKFITEVNENKTSN